MVGYLIVQCALGDPNLKCTNACMMHAFASCVMQSIQFVITVMSFPHIPSDLQVISSVYLKNKVYVTGVVPDNEPNYQLSPKCHI